MAGDSTHAPVYVVTVPHSGTHFVEKMLDLLKVKHKRIHAVPENNIDLWRISPKAKIVIVAYGPGIDFLLEDAEDRRGNPYDPAVRDLAENGVGFRLCAETLSARKISRETVLDEVTLVKSGIAEIARLQIKEGYAYLKP